MTSRKLEDLVPELAEKASLVEQICQESGFDLLIYCTLRGLKEQARLYRQSRPWSAIEVKIKKFEERGWDFLAQALVDVGECSGRHVTNAAPGESYHNYGLAFDAVPIVNGKPAWSYQDAKPYWDGYGEALKLVGLEWAGTWTSFREYPHAQLPQGANPLKAMTRDQVLEALANCGQVDLKNRGN